MPQADPREKERPMTEYPALAVVAEAEAAALTVERAKLGVDAGKAAVEAARAALDGARARLASAQDVLDGAYAKAAEAGYDKKTLRQVVDDRVA